MNVTRNKQSYTIHNHVNETIALKITVQSVGESDNNSEALRCHPPVCRCIHVYFVLNYQNGVNRFFSPKKVTPHLDQKSIFCTFTNSYYRLCCFHPYIVRVYGSGIFLVILSP